MASAVSMGERQPRAVALLLVLVLLLLAHPTTAAFTPTLFFNYIFSHHSPMLWYNPEFPWNVSYDSTPWSTLQEGMLGLGASRHFAPDGTSGARSFDLVFPFTAAFVYGRGATPSAGGSSLPIFKMDETDLASTVKGLDGPLLASEGNRPFGAQVLRFGTTYGLIEVDGVTFTTGVQSNA